MFVIGLGFRQGVTAAQIETAIRAALSVLPIHVLLDNRQWASDSNVEVGEEVRKGGHPTASIPLRACIALVASLDAKSREPGLIAFCTEHQIGLKCFSHATLAALPGPSPVSTAVQKRFGLNGICESAAMAGMPDGTLLLQKTSTQGVSVAIVGIGNGIVNRTANDEDR